VIAASNSHVLAYDNISHVPQWLSDALCRLATGGGFATRELYTDEEEMLFDSQRPIILNGIEEIVTRPDLMDRSLTVQLPTIPNNKRISERQYWEMYELYGPGILARLLDILVCALGNIGSVKLAGVPRMADFAEFITAAEPAMGLAPGEFLRMYAGNREEATDVTIEASLIAKPLIDVGAWDGTASDLLTHLEGRVSETERRSKSWPGTPHQLACAIRRLIPVLRQRGIEVSFSRDASTKKRPRLIHLREFDPL
jgi:hypothetical protein